MKRPADQIKALNALLLAAVKNDAQVTPLDTWRLFADANGDAPPREFPDLLHPNEVGYAKWAAALRPILRRSACPRRRRIRSRSRNGFESLFNGRDLTGWGYRPTTEADKASAKRWQASDPNAAEWPIRHRRRSSFDGMTASPDGRFVAMNGRLVVTTPPAGRKIQQLYTTKEFGDDFVLRSSSARRRTPTAASTCAARSCSAATTRWPDPYMGLARYKPQDWNELEVTVKGGLATATCNGEKLDIELKVPPSGPIGVEGDRGQMEYRRIRIKRM